ncbi:MAG: TerB family tellurite resistance protein [Desulfobacteraceae bacterium]|jgi:uncharacterized tellurite resistance protein B-like protein
MIKLVQKFFSSPSKDSEEGKTGNHDVRVAACALLLEMADIDGEFSPDEQDMIVSTLREHYGLPQEAAQELLDAAAREVEESIDLWRFTNLINQHYTREEKEQILELAWQVALSDHNLDRHEDYLAHKLGELLRLDNRQLIDAKLRVKRRIERQGKSS